MVNNKRIAKNTLLLYVRMLLIMVVTLYTSRVILQVLGVEDYGIYNLIAGFVTFLSFISHALVSAMQRFFNVSLGKKDLKRYQDVFSMSINILLLFSVLMIVVGETIGLWFVNTQLNIPEGRMTAAQWVYQISLLTFVANTLRTPFHASIIAHERMSFYAYISIFEVVLRLAVVFLLWIIPYDQLIFYAVLYFILIVIVNLLYMQYCRAKFVECHYIFRKDKQLLRELMGFSGWTLFGQSAVIAKNQGEAILINRFFSVIANAALGVAVQVTNAIEMFVSNFQTAFKPQLIQTHASGDMSSHKSLLCRASKFSFFLLLVLLLPVVFNIDLILKLWLKEVPENTNFFVIFILISYFFSALSSPFVTSIFATGNIKPYQISFAAIFLAGVIVIYIALKCGAPPYSVSIVSIFIQFFLMVARTYFVHKQNGLAYKDYAKNVLLPAFYVVLLVWIVPFLLSQIKAPVGIVLLFMFIEIVYSLSIIYIVGLKANERNYIIKTIKEKLK